MPEIGITQQIFLFVTPVYLPESLCLASTNQAFILSISCGKPHQPLRDPVLQECTLMTELQGQQGQSLGQGKGAEPRPLTPMVGRSHMFSKAKVCQERFTLQTPASTRVW